MKLSGRLPRLLGLLVFAASLAYLGWTAARHAASFPAVTWSPQAAGALAAAFGLYLVMVVAGGTAWALLLRTPEAPVALRTVLTVWGLAQVGKYLPGNVGQYLGRAALAKRHGIPFHRSALTFVFETTGLIVTAALGAFLAAGPNGAGQTLAAPWKIALLAVAAVAAPFGIVHALERWFPERLRRHTGVDRLPRPSVATLGGTMALYALSFACWGLAFELLARHLFAAPPEIPWGRAVPAFAVAWVAGFLTPGAPAGLGIREALLVAGTAPFYGPGTALSAALALRLVTVLGDGAAFLVAWSGGPLPPATTESAPPRPPSPGRRRACDR